MLIRGINVEQRTNDEQNYLRRKSPLQGDLGVFYSVLKLFTGLATAARIAW
jgi:hypothetical protein